MQVTVETGADLERQMTVTIPAEQVESEFDKRLKKVASTMKLDGFRSGKLSPQAIESRTKIVKQRHGKDIRLEVLADLMRNSFYEAITNEKIKPAGFPEFETVKGSHAGEPLEYIAKFEVYPEIELAAYDGVTIEKVSAQVDAEDINNMLENLRQQHADWEEVNAGANNGDKVIIDFEGTIDGATFEGGSAKDVPLELGSKRMIPGFEERLLHSKPGEERILEIQFPADYHAADLAGKPVRFAVKIHKVFTPKLPELNDSFAEKMGIKEGGLDALRNEIKSTMERELQQALQRQVKNTVMDKLLELNPIKVPKALINNEAKHLRDQTLEQFKYLMKGRQIPTELSLEMFLERAQRRVALGLIVDKIIKTHQLKADSAKVRAMVENLAAAYQSPAEVVAWYYSNKEQLASIESIVLEDQVVEKIFEQVKVVDKSSTYKDVMKQNQE